MPARAKDARRSTVPKSGIRTGPTGAAAAFYILDHQIGFALRLAYQRHSALFAARIGEDLTPTQWAAIAKLWQTGPTSQNRLGRLTGMDASTIRGVVNRLIKRGLVDTRPDREDARLLLIGLTRDGTQLYKELAPLALQVTEETLTPLTRDEQETLMRLLDKLR